MNKSRLQNIGSGINVKVEGPQRKAGSCFY